ncbi:MAG TPA: hypothetical protein IGR64_10745 [Leptolyngbyaceae cyanobacterium M65_K2018_010]|nr:hypothetical protein [Leptolyngbyaceae cyanobacterium M65_K2018_010]
MSDQAQEIRAIATQLLAGMLANPHIYATVSDEEGRGQQEQILISNAIVMATSLMEKTQTLGKP